MSEEKYDGWTNRETWAVALHINNDQGWQESVHEALREAPADDCTCPRSETLMPHDAGCPVPAGTITPWTAGQIIKDNIESAFDWDAYDNGESATRGYGHHYTIPSGLLGAREDIGSLWRVNWTELGASFLADIAEEDAHG